MKAGATGERLISQDDIKDTNVVGEGDSHHGHFFRANEETIYFLDPRFLGVRRLVDDLSYRLLTVGLFVSRTVSEDTHAPLIGYGRIAKQLRQLQTKLTSLTNQDLLARIRLIKDSPPL